MVATTLAMNWGRPFSRFLSGPAWRQAAAMNGALGGVDPTLIEAAWRGLWRQRRGEWVGITPWDALTRFIGTHTLGWFYHRRVVAGLPSGTLSADSPVARSAGVT